MRALQVIVALAALAALAWLTFGSGARSDAPPTMAPPPQAPAPEPGTPLSAERSPVPDDAPGAQQTPAARTGAETPTPLTANGLPEGMGRIRLRVYDSVTNLPLPAFAMVFANPAERRKVEEFEGGVATLDVPLDEVGELLIESEGYTPETRQEFSVSSTYPEIPLNVYLDPVAPFSGIEILAVDDQGVAVPYLQVTALRPDDPAGTPLWVRRAADERGLYQLPDLEPATYRLRLCAVEEDGQLRPLLSHEETVTFYGSERHALSIQLQSGSVLTVTVTDPTTGALRGQEVALGLITPTGEVRSDSWRARVGTELFERQGGLPGAAPATLAEPVPPGSYQLVLELTTGERQTVPVDLLPGQHRELEVRF